MNLPAGLVLIPGVMQDHRGRRYQYGRYPSGKCVAVEVAGPPLNPLFAASLERQLVESRSSLVPGDPQLNAVTQEKLATGYLHAQGKLYETMRCIHESNV